MILRILALSLVLLGASPLGASTLTVGGMLEASQILPRSSQELGKRHGRSYAKPKKWCGWYMRKRLGVSHPKYNLARSWYSWGNQSKPQVGAVVVWPHHVGLIVGQNSKGQWLIESGNDGGKVKIRPWSNLHKAKFRIA